MRKGIRLITLLGMICCVLLSVQAQDFELPIDTAVRIGKLENGLTYMIRRNALPENKADFYIAQKVGSILEEDNQSGLAHFLEHMCFNGTEHFPGNSLKQYLERIGVKFGENLNAYTSIDETVYHMTNVPVLVEGAIDSCLWILCDWANGLTLDGKEIDKERGVIHEEWRSRQNATMRIYDQLLPILYPDSRYAKRLPIGSMGVVDNFPYQALRDYYEKWYRPDLQGIVVVGDINVDEIEAKIKQIFSPIKMPENAAERVYFPVAKQNGLTFAFAKDKELQVVEIGWMFRHDAVPTEKKNLFSTWCTDVVTGLSLSLMNQRFSELTEKANPPYSGASVGDGEYMISKTAEAFSASVSCKEEGIDTAFVTMLRELERARRFGFTQTELDRLKASYKSSLETSYAERNTRKNGNFTGSMVRRFIDNTPLMSADDNYNIYISVLDAITLEMVNSVIPSLMADSSQVLMMIGPDKEGIVYPTQEEMLAMIEAVRNETLTPYEDKVSDDPLIKEIPTGGKVVKTEEGMYGSTIWTLSNGIKVVLKPTDFKADEISMYGISTGGSATYPDEDIINISVINALVPNGGLGSFDNIELEKKMAGKIAGASATISNYLEIVTGDCTPKFFEELMQLTYLRFTAPRQDMESFESYKEHLKTNLKNRDLNPSTALSDTLIKELFNNHPRALRMKVEDVDKINYDRVMEIYMDRFSNADDFTFTFVGNINLDSVKPYIETYLGALPSTGRVDKIHNLGLRISEGIKENNFLNKMETPKTTECVYYSGDISYTLKNYLMMRFVSQILDLIYTEEVREKEGGTYGVSVSGSLSKIPEECFTLTISFNTDPERRVDMTNIILAQIDKFAAEGPSQEDVDKVREYMLKKYAENVKENSYWEGQLVDYYVTGGIDMHTDYVKFVNSITPKDLKKFMKKLLKQKNRIEVSMSPLK